MIRSAIKSVSRTIGLSAQTAFSSTKRFYGKIKHFLVMFYRDNLQVTINKFAASAPKRFYKNAGILSCDGKYEITLDSKKLKTPSGAVFQVANEPLAIAGMQMKLIQKKFETFPFSNLNFVLTFCSCS